MITYKIKGLHCGNCSTELETRINASQHDAAVSIDYDHRELTVDESKADLTAIFKILEFNKLTLIDSHEETDSTDHQHGHHGHDHHGLTGIKSQSATTKITVVFYLNLMFSIIEFIFGFLFNSMAIVSDAVHDLGDALSVGAAGYFERLSGKEANDQYSFGHQRFSLLGALLTSVVLIGGSAIVIFHSVPRIFSPEPVNYQGMLWLAIAAIGANGFAAWLMSKGHSHNESLINLHMIEDLLGWLGVLAVSITLHFTDWYYLDPLLSVAVALFIMVKTWPLFKETIQIFLEATPKNVSRPTIEELLLRSDEVTNISHLHIWSIDGREHAMTVTLSTGCSDQKRLEEVKTSMRQELVKKNITHSTIEFVYDPADILKKRFENE